ncbi:MAG: hypothetical protein WBW31_12550 [Candidatus Sulfotelmatobacter sp.]
MKAELAQMLKQGKGGAIVNTSSGACGIRFRTRPSMAT